MLAINNISFTGKVQNKDGSSRISTAKEDYVLAAQIQKDIFIVTDKPVIYRKDGEITAVFGTDCKVSIAKENTHNQPVLIIKHLNGERAQTILNLDSYNPINDAPISKNSFKDLLNGIIEKMETFL